MEEQTQFNQSKKALMIFNPAKQKRPVARATRSELASVFDPRVHKRPMSKEMIADAILGRRTKVSSKVEDVLSDALYDSVHRMIYGIVSGYELTCIDGTDDLVQDCVQRVFAKLEYFNSKKGAFTTWVWCVCKSVLNRIYRRNQRYGVRFAEWNKEAERASGGDEGKKITPEVEDAISELFELHEDKQDILTEMFGDRDDMHVPRRINMSEIARNLDKPHHEIYLFMVNCIRPFVVRKFGTLEAMI